MAKTTRQATIWVAKGVAKKRHLLDCDYFEGSSKLRKATKKEMKLPTCQWCIDRMNAALKAA